MKPDIQVSQEKFWRRCSHLAPLSDFVGQKFQEDGKEFSKNVGSEVQLSLFELFLPKLPNKGGIYDYCGFLWLKEEWDKNLPPAPFVFLSPETLGNNLNITPRGIVFSRIPLTTFHPNLRSFIFSFHRLKRNRKTLEINFKIESLVQALDFQMDLSGSFQLLHAICDRIELLNHIPEGELLFRFEYILPEINPIETYLTQVSPTALNTNTEKLFFLSRQLRKGLSQDQSKLMTDSIYSIFRVGEKEQEENLQEKLREYINQIKRKNSLNAEPEERESSESYLVIKGRELEKKRQDFVNLVYRDSSQLLPILTPIILEVASDLIHLVDGGNKGLTPEFQALINEMKASLQEDLGFETPFGVLVRGNTDIYRSNYTIRLDENAVGSGTVQLNQLLVDGNVDQLALISVKGSEGSHPLTGRRCAWISADDKELVEEKGFSTWDARSYMTLDLLRVVRRYLYELIHLDTIYVQLAALENEYLRKIEESVGGLPRFMNIIRGLLEERVAIRELETICLNYLEFTNSHMPQYKILEELRALEAIKKGIAINQGIEDRDGLHRVFLLDESLAELIKKGLVHQGETKILALEPDPTQHFLSEVRNTLKDNQSLVDFPIILVNDWEIRLPIRKLVELEFPNLMVMLERELIGNLQPIARIG